MPTPMVSTAALGEEFEHVRPELETMWQMDAGLFGEIEDKTETAEGVSMRQARIPVSLAQPGYFAQFNADFGDMGVGNGLITDALTLTPVFLEQAMAWSWLTEISANSGKKAIKDIVQELHDKAMAMFKSNIDANLSANTGDGTIDTVVSTVAGQITVNNANLFQDQGIYQVWNSTLTVNRGNAVVSFSDATNNQLNLSGSVPAGTTAGDKLLISGSSGVAQSCLFGIPYLQLQSNTGTFIGLNRGSYPGRLSTPLIGAGTPGALTQLIGRRMLNAIDTALGIDYTSKHRIVFHGNLDQGTAWELVGVAVSQVIQNQLTGNSSQDMLKKEMPMTIAGREFFRNIHAIPGRLDALCLDCWGKIIIQNIDHYSVGGMSVFPAYAGSGGLAAGSLAYLVWGGQMYTANPRAGSYATGLTQPYSLGK